MMAELSSEISCNSYSATMSSCNNTATQDDNLGEYTLLVTTSPGFMSVFVMHGMLPKECNVCKGIKAQYQCVIFISAANWP